ncbi:aliphatic sulfonate ABC transporter substrate-binding protein [Sporomusa sphaeroides]|uniref:aliphatic sulfonate ABC transporter substrate-binding protein n=1 Tax=Sporomusa sphaeroides TaxID=47679 RepID=UPI003159298C
MNFLKLILVMTATIGVIIGVSGCSTNTENKNIKVRLANFPNITHSQSLLLRTDGKMEPLIDKNNKSVSVEWKTFNAGPAEVEALMAGEVDIGYIGPGPAINAFVKSKGDIMIIAGATDAGAILVSRENLVERDVKKLLDGRKIAVPQFGNTQDLCLRNLLEQNGLKDTAKGGTVEVVQIENPDIKTLLEKGDIDAALVPEPWGARLVNEIGANIVLDYKDIWRNGDYTTAVIVARKDFLTQYPDLVEAFLEQHVKATLAINQNLAANKQIINKKIGELTQKTLSESVLNGAFQRLKVTYDPQTQSVIEMADMAKAAGFLREKPNMQGIFDLAILNKVLQAQNLEPVKSN